MTIDEVLEKISQIAIDNDLRGYPSRSKIGPDFLFCQDRGNEIITIIIPWGEVADQAWPIIEARLKFYGNKKVKNG